MQAPYGLRIRYKYARDDYGEVVELLLLGKTYESDNGEMIILIKTMAADFEPEKYEDHYQNQYKELIEAKAAG